MSDPYNESNLLRIQTFDVAKVLTMAFIVKKQGFCYKIDLFLYFSFDYIFDYINLYKINSTKVGIFCGRTGNY